MGCCCKKQNRVCGASEGCYANIARKCAKCGKSCPDKKCSVNRMELATQIINNNIEFYNAGLNDYQTGFYTLTSGDICTFEEAFECMCEGLMSMKVGRDGAIEAIRSVSECLSYADKKMLDEMICIMRESINLLQKICEDLSKASACALCDLIERYRNCVSEFMPIAPIDLVNGSNGCPCRQISTPCPAQGACQNGCC